MSAFVTGGTGFIGKRLVRRLLQRDKEQVYILIVQCNAGIHGVAEWSSGAPDAARVTAIAGDISKPDLGVAPKDARRLKGKIDHFFHLAAVYDLAADPRKSMEANVAGAATRSPSPRRSARAASTI